MVEAIVGSARYLEVYIGWPDDRLAGLQIDSATWLLSLARP